MTEIQRESGPATVVDFLQTTVSLLSLGWVRNGAALVLMTGAGVAIDTGSVGDDAANALTFGLSLGTLILQYWLIRTLLAELGYSVPTRPRFPAFFLMGIVATIGIVLGFIALIVPGVVLMVRWSLSTPLVIGSETGAVASLGESWRATEGYFRPIFLATAAVWSVALAVMVGGFLLEPLGADRLLASSVANLGINAGLIVGWHLSVAVYTFVGGPPPSPRSLTRPASAAIRHAS